jgi:hypothetical protein
MQRYLLCYLTICYEVSVAILGCAMKREEREREEKRKKRERRERRERVL